MVNGGPGLHSGEKYGRVCHTTGASLYSHAAGGDRPGVHTLLDRPWRPCLNDPGGWGRRQRVGVPRTAAAIAAGAGSRPAIIHSVRELAVECAPGGPGHVSVVQDPGVGS